MRRPVSLYVDGLRLEGEVYSPQGGAPFPALCLCHGLPRGLPPEPGDRGYPGLAEDFTVAGFLAFIFNFRGTGPSQGNFDILGWARDLEAALDYLSDLPQVDRARLSVMGFSAGAAVSCYGVARDPRVSSLALAACPAELGFEAWPGGLSAFLEQARRTAIIRDPGFPPSLEEWSRGFREVSPLRHVGQVSPRPLLILHGEADEVVPPAHARRLYEAALPPKELCLIPGAGHRLRREEKAMAAARAWLKRVNSRTP